MVLFVVAITKGVFLYCLKRKVLLLLKLLLKKNKQVFVVKIYIKMFGQYVTLLYAITAIAMIFFVFFPTCI